MSGITYPLPEWAKDSHWAAVEIKCKHHHSTGDPFLVRFSTFDGKQNVTELGESSYEEFVGYQPSDDERQRIAERGLGSVLSFAVAQEDEGDVQHHRMRLVCERPSCSYDLPLRSDTLGPLKNQLFVMWEHKLPDRVIPDYAKWLDRQP